MQSGTQDVCQDLQVFEVDLPSAAFDAGDGGCGQAREVGERLAGDAEAEAVFLDGLSGLSTDGRG